MIRRVSKKRDEQLKLYARLRRSFLKAHPWCSLHDGGCRATEIHHSRGRSNTLLTDVRHWRGVCRVAHLWITEHPKEARERGLICGVGQWNSADRSD